MGSQVVFKIKTVCYRISRFLALLAFLVGLGFANTSTLPAFAQSDSAAEKQEPPKYLSFLDLLPLALKNDDGIKAANLGYEAALESEKASRSGLYPKADITVNHAEQDDSKPGAANDQYSPDH